MEIRNYKAVGRGALKAQFDVYMPKLQMTLRDCLYFSSEKGAWVTPPSIKFQGEYGYNYKKLIIFDTDELNKAWCDHLISMIVKGQYKTREERTLPSIAKPTQEEMLPF